MLRRIVRAAWLDPSLYVEVLENPAATVQAGAIILLVAISLALPGFSRYADTSNVNVFTWSFSYVVLSWLIFSALAYLPGRYLIGREVTFGGLMRAVGFANVPGLFYVLLGLGGFAALLVNTVLLLWFLGCVMVAFHQSLRASILASFPLAALGLFVTLGLRNYLFTLFVA